jgi:hypothetical protein
MTAPDHTPYLAATDLRTPEDVADWLDAWSLDAKALLTLEQLRTDYRARLDRERRQACRRAARCHIVQARAHHDDAARWPTLPAEGWDYPTECAEYVAVSLQCLQDSVRRALEFRAAARAK